MSSSLLSLTVSLDTEGLHNDKCTDYKFCLKYISAINNNLNFKCLEYNKVIKNTSIKV